MRKFHPAEIKFARHASADEIVKLFFAPLAGEFGAAELSQMGIEDGAGEQVSGAEMLGGIREQHVWGFADTNTGTIHWWADNEAAIEVIAHMLGHEVAHLVDPQPEHDADEAHAEIIGEAVAQVFKEMRDAGRLYWPSVIVNVVSGLGCADAEDLARAINEAVQSRDVRLPAPRGAQ